MYILGGTNSKEMVRVPSFLRVYNKSFENQLDDTSLHIHLLQHLRG